jgi:hypothetical protein
MHLVRLVAKASSHAFISVDMVLLSPMDVWTLDTRCGGLVRGWLV